MGRRGPAKPRRNLRGLFFTGAAIGGILAILGVGTVACAWIYPQWLATELGRGITPDDVQASFNVQLLGTLLGLVTAAAGLALVVWCFAALNRDLERRLRR